MLKMLARILKLCGKYRKRILWAILPCAVKAIFANAPIILSFYLLLKFYQNEATPQTCLFIGGLMAISILIQIVCQNISDRLQSASGYYVFADLRMKLGEHLKRLPMGFFTEGNIGRISSILTQDMSFIEEASMSQLAQMITFIVSELTMVIWIFFLDYRIGIAALISVAAIVLCGVLYENKMIYHSQVRQKMQGELTRSVLDYTEGMGIIKTFNLLGDKSKDLTKTFQKNRDSAIAFEVEASAYMSVIGAVYAIVTVATLALSVYLCIEQIITVPFLLGVILFIFSLYMPIYVFYMENTRLTVMSAALDRIEALFDEVELEDQGSKELPKEWDGPEISFEHVDFSYDKAQVLHDISFEVERQSMVAFVGPSGSGKSTIANLVARFWDIDSGSIQLRGVDIRDIPLKTLMDQISMVFQRVYLFQDTVYNNIVMGRPDATKEEVYEAAKKAGCYDFIMDLKDGFDTIIGEGGASLSGGEKQRLSIARCILKDAPIVILDEATASVDADNERNIQEAINELVKGKTLLVIAHRLHTIENADQIMVINEGKIEERGNHQELMEHEGIYANFIGKRERKVG